jgi:hypothetical protein
VVGTTARLEVGPVPMPSGSTMGVLIGLDTGQAGPARKGSGEEEQGSERAGSHTEHPNNTFPNFPIKPDTPGTW